MNVRRYKCPVPVVAPFGDLMVEVRPLAPLSIDEAVEVARGVFTSRGLDPVGDHYELEEAVQLLAATTQVSPAAIRLLHIHEVWRLYSRWNRVQHDHTPDLDKLGKHLKWGVVEDADISVDGAAAYQSASPAEFFGGATASLTIGQLAYFLLVRLAFVELHVSGKKVTQAWLQRMKQSD